MGQADAGIAAIRQAVTLDPLNPFIRRHLGYALYLTRRYPEAITTLQEALALDPDAPLGRAFLGRTYYSLGDFERARVSCDSKLADDNCQWVLAVAYHKLGRQADAETALAKMKASVGDAAAYQYTTIYTQWGNRTSALEWLDTAMRLRDSGLVYLKTDPFLDPLRKEPRFQAVMRELKFPN
jgi:tetratricopeptide (TPR) repeat protein